MTEKNKKSAKDAEDQKPTEQRPPTSRSPEEEENSEATMDQDPGERQKRNQGWQKEDPLAS